MRLPTKRTPGKCGSVEIMVTKLMLQKNGVTFSDKSFLKKILEKTFSKNVYRKWPPKCYLKIFGKLQNFKVDFKSLAFHLKSPAFSVKLNNDEDV